jgi:hypothetical protein
MSRNRLYALLILACLSGFVYLFYNLHYWSENSNYGVCIIKNISGIPCPSCGTTRAVRLLMQGSFKKSLLINPFGIIVALIMITTPLWLLLDLLFKKETLYMWYKKTEQFVKIKGVAIPLILMVIFNWIWNIYKGL